MRLGWNYDILNDLCCYGIRLPDALLPNIKYQNPYMNTMAIL